MKHFLSVLSRGPVARLLLILSWLAGPAARAQTPAWQAAVVAAHNGWCPAAVSGTATDASGNVYVVGSFNNTVRFGNTALVSSSGPTSDVYVAKWNPIAGGYGWAGSLKPATGLLR